MLPYWQGPVIGFSLKPLTTTVHQHLQMPSSGFTAVSSTSSSVRAATDCYTSESDLGTDNEWDWINEDRLLRTPAEETILEERLIEEQNAQTARIASLELSTFPTLCDFLSMDSASKDEQHRHHHHRGRGRHPEGEATSKSKKKLHRNRARRRGSPEPVGPKAAWPSAGLIISGDISCLLSTTAPPPPPPPMPLSAEFFLSSPAAAEQQQQQEQFQHSELKDGQEQKTMACKQANNSNLQTTVIKNSNSGSQGAGANQAVASGRSLQEIEAAVQLTRNNSNQQQRYEMRGGHIVEICSKVDFPDRVTRNVSVTVEATHSNGCHRVIMLKGLTAKKRPDIGPKVKDCRLRMDQIVMTRPSASTHDWLKTITMSYDSDFQVGVGEDKTRAL